MQSCYKSCKPGISISCSGALPRQGSPPTRHPRTQMETLAPCVRPRCSKESALRRSLASSCRGPQHPWILKKLQTAWDRTCIRHLHEGHVSNSRTVKSAEINTELDEGPRPIPTISKKKIPFHSKVWRQWHNWTVVLVTIMNRFSKRYVRSVYHVRPTAAYLVIWSTVFVDDLYLQWKGNNDETAMSDTHFSWIYMQSSGKSKHNQYRSLQYFILRSTLYWLKHNAKFNPGIMASWLD